MSSALLTTHAVAPPSGKAPGQAGHWARLARAMGASAGGAALSGVASLAAAKILAVTLGPSAVAALQTIQQARQTAVVAATANGQTALVQGASSLDGIERARYVRTVACIFAAGTALVSLAVAHAPHAVLQRTGLASIAAGAPSWLGVAVALTAAYVFFTALLNTLGKVATLAVLQVAGPGAMALLAYPVAKAGGGRLIVLMVTVSAAVSAGAALAMVLKHWSTLREWFTQSNTWFDRRASAHFFSISTAMLLTGFLGSAAVLLVRGNIVRSQGLQQTGLFDAAWSISMNQVTLVLASVQTYYLPALSRARTQEEKSAEISRVLLAATLVSAPVIALLALFKPWVLHVLYSAAFREAHQYLRWTLLGDFLKVTSWILSVPMLAAADMKLFLLADLAASSVYVGLALLLTRWRGPAESAAIAFLAMYVVHLGICALYVRFRQGIRLGNQTIALWAAGLILVAVATALGWKGGF